MSNICIIPARSGSKRIKNKNLKLFFEKPLIYWSIKTAINSKLFNKVIVSTNDKFIAFKAKKFGAFVPFLRSKKNSSDTATVHSAVRETVLELKSCNESFDNVCCILPTAVLINSNHLRESFDVFKKNKKKFLIGVTKFPSPPQKAFILSKNSSIKLFNKNRLFNRTQSYKNVYYDAGQFYWGAAKNYIQYEDFKEIYNKKSMGFVLKENEIQDIDDIEDFKLAKIKFKYNYKKR